MGDEHGILMIIRAVEQIAASDKQNRNMMNEKQDTLSPPIVLLTDFGTKDGFVGVMKGVIASIAPQTAVIDLSHEVEAQNILHAALILKGSFSYFPEGSIFLCIIDPGVGSKRNIILMEHQNRLFLAPDNGLLPALFANSDEKEEKEIVLYSIENSRYFLQGKLSESFHGRDIFAPVGAYLSIGQAHFGNIGKLLPLHSLHAPPLLPAPIITEERIEGQILYFDHFGNALTNITAEQIEKATGEKKGSWSFMINGDNQGVLLTHYAAAKEGKLSCLINSWGMLELFVKNGNAKKVFSLKKGIFMKLFLQK